MASLYEQLRADIVAAMKAGDKTRVTILRTADAAIKRAEMDGNLPLDDALVIATLRKAVKNLIDANAEFARGGRQDLVTANESEIAVLQKYLPSSLDPAQLAGVIDRVIGEVGATSKKEMGKVMAALKQAPEAGRIDFSTASRVVQSRLP